MDRATVLQRSFPKFLQVTAIVDRLCETRLAVVAALDDVLGDSGQVDAGQAGHVRDAPCWDRACATHPIASAGS